MLYKRIDVLFGNADDINRLDSARRCQPRCLTFHKYRHFSNKLSRTQFRHLARNGPIGVNNLYTSLNNDKKAIRNEVNNDRTSIYSYAVWRVSIDLAHHYDDEQGIRMEVAETIH